MPPARRIRDTLANLALALAAPALVLLLLNGMLAVAGYGTPTAFFIPAEPPYQQVRLANPDFALQFVPRSLSRGAQPIALQPKRGDSIRVFVLGESAAAGDPEPPFGFARALDVLLREYTSGRRVEVVNTAMTAMNSHVIRRIAADAAREGPDAFVIYMGNNEVVGPFGPRALPEPIYDHATLVRALMAARRSRLGQLFLSWTGRDGGPGREWRGMEAFLDLQVPADDRRLQRMYGYFEANLRAVIDSAHAAGARVLLATVPINLRSCAPFASMHRADLSPDARERWRQHFDEGRAAQGGGDCAGARRAWAQAAALDDGYAELAFAMGQCAAVLGEREEADRLWAQARDLDSLRFRADSRINRIVRDVAAQANGRDLALVDLEGAIAAAADGGAPGDDLFVDHVHLDFRGNVIAARATFEALHPRLDGVRVAALPSDAAELEALVRRRLVYDARSEQQIASLMYKRKTRPPFVGQLGHEAEMASLRARLVTLREAARAVTWADREQALRAAVEARPDDGVLVQRLSEHYGQGGQPDRALASVEGRLGRAPYDGDLRAAWVDALIRAGRANDAVAFLSTANGAGPIPRQEALRWVGSKLIEQGRGDLAGPLFLEVLAKAPDDAQALMNLGGLAVQRGDGETAIRRLTHALEVAPDSAQAMVTLASAWILQRRNDEGLRWYRAAVDADPHNHLAYYGLALQRLNAGALREGAADLRRAVELSPEFVDGHRLLARVYEQLGEAHLAAAEEKLADAFQN
jgi:tetratricopeptide (TPR) repeat protein